MRYHKENDLKGVKRERPLYYSVTDKQDVSSLKTAVRGEGHFDNNGIDSDCYTQEKLVVVYNFYDEVLECIQNYVGQSAAYEFLGLQQLNECDEIGMQIKKWTTSLAR